MKKTKILHIIKSLGRGGAEMLLPETIKLHDRTWLDFHCIYFLPWKNQMVPALESTGCKVSCFAAKTNIHLMLQARNVARYVRQNQIDVIHAHLPWAGVLARIVGKMTGVPVLYTEHNKQERYHMATRILNLTTMNWLTRVIAVSADVAESIRKNKPGLKAPLITVLNGVNVDTFGPGLASGSEVRTTFGIPADATVIGTIAVFRFQKRLDVWLDVAKTILEKQPDAHFIIVGDGPLKSEIVGKAAALQIEARVHFAGLQTEVRPYLAAMDIYMMSSIFEGLPIAMLEAMASGCPVVTTDAGGIKEVIRHETDGLMCSVDESQKLSDFALTLIRDSKKRTGLATNARKRVVESFSMKAMVANLEAVYKGVLGL